MPLPVFLVLWSAIFICLLGDLVLHPIPWIHFIVFAPAGLVWWFVFEYLMHRYLFHAQFKSSLGKYFIFAVHGNHHTCPRDCNRNLMPVIVSLPLAAMFAFIYNALMGHDNGRAFFWGFLLGYVQYDLFHYSMHQVVFSNRFLKSIQHHHLLHHYHDERKNYGVTTVVLDRMAGTLCQKRGVKKYATNK